MRTLFVDDNNKKYCEDDVYNALIQIGAADCQTIFLHSSLVFGELALQGGRTNRREYLGAFYSALQRLGVKYLIVPTFTYSFCNNEVYNVEKSPTSIGALNEFIRKLPNRYRTLDPLLSFSIPIELKNKFENLGVHSLGKGSGFEVLQKMSGVKFLFLGTRLYESFTFLHHVECLRSVPYRFNMPFTGKILSYDNKIYEVTQYIHTACTGASLREDTKFEDYLTEQGYLKKIPLGNSFVSAISQDDAFREINKVLDEDIYYFLNEPPTQLEKKYTYDSKVRRITHC